MGMTKKILFLLSLKGEARKNAFKVNLLEREKEGLEGRQEDEKGGAGRRGRRGEERRKGKKKN